MKIIPIATSRMVELNMTWFLPIRGDETKWASTETATGLARVGNEFRNPLIRKNQPQAIKRLRGANTIIKETLWRSIGSCARTRALYSPPKALSIRNLFVAIHSTSLTKTDHVPGLGLDSFLVLF